MKWPQLDFERLYREPSRNGIYKPEAFHGSGFKIVNMGELFAYDFINGQEMNRVRLTEAEIEKNGLLSGDLLFGRRSLVEAGAGKCSLVSSIDEPTTFESSIIRVRLDNKQVNPRFYFYWFKSPLGRGRIRAIVSGTNVKGIRGSDLKRVRVPIPLQEEQDQIARILSNYDNLIENNRRRIQLLELSARLLYKEWFAHLRFPGHEHVKIVKSVPDGWKKKTSFDVMEVLSGGTPKTNVADYWDGEIPFYTPKDSVDTAYVYETEKTLTEYGLKNCNSRLYPKDTIFITARGTVGNLNLAEVPMAMNQSCYALVAKAPLTQYFLYFALVTGIEQLKSRAVGAVFDAVIRDTFKLIPFVVPAETLVRDFTETVSPMLRQIDNLLAQNRKLKQARDLLLPRLMNGEIPV